MPRSSAPSWRHELHPTRNGELDVFTLGEWSRRKLWWRCAACGHEWQTSVRMRRVGRGCPRCGHEQMRAAQQRVRPEHSIAVQRPDLAAELHPTRNGELDPFTLGAWVSRPMWWLCPACGHEWRTSPGPLLGLLSPAAK